MKNTQDTEPPANPPFAGSNCSTAFSVQVNRAGRWNEMLDCPTPESAIEVRNHLAATRRQKFRAVKVTTEVMP